MTRLCRSFSLIPLPVLGQCAFAADLTTASWGGSYQDV